MDDNSPTSFIVLPQPRRRTPESGSKAPIVCGRWRGRFGWRGRSGGGGGGWRVEGAGGGGGRPRREPELPGRPVQSDPPDPAGHAIAEDRSGPGRAASNSSNQIVLPAPAWVSRSEER